MRTKFWRTKYLTGSRIQMKYLTLLVLSMSIPVIFVGGCLYYLIFSIMAEQIGIPEYIAYNLFPVIKKINFILLVSIPPIFAALILWGIILSHRFAGPLERLEKEIKNIASQRDFSRRLGIRKHDDIKPIVTAMNHLLDKIEGKSEHR